MGLLSCCGCCEDADEEVFAGSQPTKRSQEEIVTAGFLRTPPAIVSCIGGAAAGKAIELERCADWQSQKWRLSESLAPLDEWQGEQDGPAFNVLRVGGVYSVAAARGDELWVHLNARHQGVGGAPCRAGDEFRIGEARIRIQSVPSLPAASSQGARDGPADGGDEAEAKKRGVARKLLRFKPTNVAFKKSGALGKVVGGLGGTAEEELKGEKVSFNDMFHANRRRSLADLAEHATLTIRVIRPAAAGLEPASEPAAGGDSDRPAGSGPFASLDAALGPSDSLDAALGSSRRDSSSRRASDAPLPPSLPPATVEAMGRPHRISVTDSQLPPTRRRRMLKASRLMPPAAASDAPPRPPPLRSIGLSAVREAPTAREIVAAASRAIRTVVGGGMDYARVSGAEAGGPGAGGLGPGDVEVTAIRAADEGAAEGGCGDAGSGGDGGGLASSRSDEPQAAARSSCDLGTPKMRRASTAGEMTLRDGDGLAFNQAGELVLLQSVAGDTSVGLAWTEAAAGLGLIPAARAVFHGGRFWMSEAPPLPERPEPTAEAASAADDDASPRPQAAPRHASSPTLSIRAACSPASSTLPMGSSFVIGGSTFRLERPLPEARSHELWGSLAVGLSLGLFGGGALHEFMMLPGWAWTNRGTIGRYNNKRATLPLRDLKIRRRHASFVLEGFKPLDKSLPSGGLWLQPWKGKPCLLLLGRQNHQLYHPWQLQSGDVFCVGHSHLRVERLTKPAPARAKAKAEAASEAGAEMVDAEGRGPPPRHPPLMLVEDKGRRYRRAVNKEKRRKKKLAGQSSSDDDDSSSDDEKPKESSGEERTLEEESLPFLRLFMVHGPWRGQWFDIGAAGGTIGSSARCTVSLPNDLTVEDVHCAISHQADGCWYLSDAHSKAGTFLLLPDDGGQIDIGDVVRIGGTEINFFVRPWVAPPPA